MVLELVAGGPVEVIDGDTVHRGLFRYRLMGFDAPEIRQARCPEERALGEAASRRLTELVASGRVMLARETRRRDRYGRGLAWLYVDGRDVVIEEGLARAYDGRSRRQGWCE